MAATVELTGKVRAIVWEAEDRTAVIAKLDMGRAAKGPQDPDAPLVPELTYRFHGRWATHEKYGEQFQFQSYAKADPLDQRGVLVYLATTVRGVGTSRAMRLWKEFGADAIRVLREEPQRVVDAGILPEDLAREASETLHREGAFEALKVQMLSLLAGRGFQVAKVIRECIRWWGARAPEVVRRNPYVLMLRGIASCGFKRCDKLYLDTGGRPDRLRRQLLCTLHQLREDGQGHTWHAAPRIGQGLLSEIPTADPPRAFRLGTRTGRLRVRQVEGGTWVAEARQARHEADLAAEVRCMLDLDPPPQRPALTTAPRPTYGLDEEDDPLTEEEFADVA